MKQIQLARPPGEAQWTITLIVTTTCIYALWEVVAHHFLMDLPMVVWHWVSAGVGTLVAVAITVTATRTILRQQREMEALARLKDDLTHMVVHDMRSPLTGIVGSLSLLESRSPDQMSPFAAEMVGMATKSSQSLLELVNTMLDISRMESGGTVLDLEETDLQPLVDDALVVASVLARDKKLELRVERAPDLPPRAWVDGGKLRRVMENLLVNAVKFTPRGGKVSLHLSWLSPGSHLVIRVTDTGEGIPLEHQAHVFDRYYQADGARGRGMASSGLGLAFCRLVAQAHGGSIRVSSQPGQGSSFTVDLPARTPPGREGSGTPPSASEGDGTARA